MFMPNTRIIRNDINNNTYGVRFQCNSNLIFENNFEDNDNNAYFSHCLFNKWVSNYWGQPYDEPYQILGKIGFILPLWPFYNYDMNPASEPYDINANIPKGCDLI